MQTSFPTIEKPTLLLNEHIARRNIHRMVERAHAAQVRFRPHFKTHQSAEIGEWFRAEGISAITVSSVDMALYFSQHGWQDITIAFPANIRQAGAMNRLAHGGRLGLLVESPETVAALAQTLDAPVDVWLKIDAGAHRTGLPWDHTQAVLEVIQSAQQVQGFTVRGLLTHAGHTYGARGQEQVCQRYTESATRMHALRCALQDAGAGPLEVSVGDTPGTSLCADLGPVDEIRPGNFVFYDTQQVQIGACGWADVAVALACPVVAKHPERGEAVIYGGAVHLSKDYLMNGEQRSYGAVCLPEENGGWSAPLAGAYVSGLSQEHGILRLQTEDLNRLNIGDLVCILPAHSCLTVTLMKRYLTTTGRVIDTLNVAS